MITKVTNLLFLLCVFSFVNAQDSAPKDWFHLDPSSSKFNGVATEKTYELLKGRTSQTIVVAVIDSGVDFDHEDLKDVMWVNVDEIPGNGIDDDNNGYIDDIHGWNFIGGKDGKNVGVDTYEVTRLYGKYKYKYDSASPEKLTKKQKEEYEKFLVYKKEVEEKRTKAQENIENMNQTETMLVGAVEALGKKLGDDAITKENVDKISPDGDRNLIIAKNLMGNIFESGETFESVDDLKGFINSEITKAKENFTNQLDYAYNPDFDTRDIIGDNYSDSYEKGYGNNDVEGPDASHGTHVAGIIAAARNNDTGMNGVSNNVRIMSIRAVPDGDERDKDVANAIIYAVDNGASIINMSFGKGFPWDKEAVDKAVKYARKKDVLMVHAAGNGSQDNDSADNYPNDNYKKRGLFRKKKADNWIEVGALNWKKGQESVAPFSNYGKDNVDIFAPGMAIYSTIPDDGYASFQGTSMASPVVAGVAAVIRSYFPSLTAQQVKEVLFSTVNPHDIEVYKPGSKELVNFKDLSVTGGAVNLEKAVKKAMVTKGKKKIKIKKSRV